MFDIGWSELALIGAVALVVIGPKDLPKALYTVGKFARKARMMAREFQNGIDDMVRQAEVEDLKKEALALRDLNLKRQAENIIDPAGHLREAITPPKLELPKVDEVVSFRSAPVTPLPEPVAAPPSPATPVAATSPSPSAPSDKTA